jgi:hypothetical protein
VQIGARQRINLDRSTPAGLVGYAAWHLRPLLEGLKQRPRLFADRTTAPVLIRVAAAQNQPNLRLHRRQQAWGGIQPTFATGE